MCPEASLAPKRAKHVAQQAMAWTIRGKVAEQVYRREGRDPFVAGKQPHEEHDDRNSHK
jgi:hypothetical protein